MTIPFKEVEKILAKDKKVQKHYKEIAPHYDLIHSMIKARNKAGISQKELAKRMGTTQSVVARIENVNHLPSMKTIYKYAEAIGAKPVITFVIN